MSRLAPLSAFRCSAAASASLSLCRAQGEVPKRRGRIGWGPCPQTPRVFFRHETLPHAPERTGAANSDGTRMTCGHAAAVFLTGCSPAEPASASGGEASVARDRDGADDGAPAGRLPWPPAPPLPPSDQARLAGPLGSDCLLPPPSFRQQQEGPNPAPTTPSSRRYDDCSHPSLQSSLQAHFWIGKDCPRE